MRIRPFVANGFRGPMDSAAAVTMALALVASASGCTATNQSKPEAQSPAPAQGPTASTAPASSAPSEQATPIASAEPVAPSAPVVESPLGRIEKTKWGELDGQEVDLYTLTGKSGMVAKITNFGGILTELDVADRNGKLDDVVLGWDTLDEYAKNAPHLGSTIGRVGNRIANAQFELDGKVYKLAANNGPNALHGGIKGWDKHVWDATPRATPNGPALELTLVSKDGDEGYPGTVHAKATFTLAKDSVLRVEMTATTDKPTPINMVNHSYWNLRGGTTGDIKDDVLTLYADQYTPGLPPDGKVLPVAGTPFDFRKPKALGHDLMATGDTPPGYDENWIVSGDPHALRRVAHVSDPISGRTMTIESNQPGAQLYTANYMDGSTKGRGRVHAQHSAFCIETQKFPNSINVPAWKNDVVVRPGQTYKHVMIVKFGVQ
jgi:aldose 1-epimerase